MASNEQTSQSVAEIAGRALRDPASITLGEIQTLAASVLTQAPDHGPPLGAHAYYNNLAGPSAVQNVLARRRRTLLG